MWTMAYYHYTTSGEICGWHWTGLCDATVSRGSRPGACCQWNGNRVCEWVCKLPCARHCPQVTWRNYNQVVWGDSDWSTDVCVSIIGIPYQLDVRVSPCSVLILAILSMSLDNVMCSSTNCYHGLSLMLGTGSFSWTSTLRSIGTNQWRVLDMNSI